MGSGGGRLPNHGIGISTVPFGRRSLFPGTLLFSGMELFVAFIVAFLSGYLAIQLLLKIVAKVGLLPFIIYRIVLAIFILIFYSG